jgi:hypothetical protein
MSVRHTHPAAPLRTQHARRLYGGASTTRKSLLHTLIQVMGHESVEKIIAEFGGTRIWVPVRSTPDAKLTRILGDGAASALCALFGGDYLEIPNTTSTDGIYRRIAELHRQGCKINDIALAVGRSRRTVFRLLSRKITDLRRSGGLAADSSHKPGAYHSLRERHLSSRSDPEPISVIPPPGSATRRVRRDP